MMVNEPCIKGCPARISHISELNMCVFKCEKYMDKNSLRNIFKMPAIFPWDLEYYSAIGINNFKVTSRELTRALCVSTRYLNNYLNCIENGADVYGIGEFLDDMFGISKYRGLNAEVSHIKPYLRDIKYFTKYVDLCATRCHATCFKCEEDAKCLEEVFKIIT